MSASAAPRRYTADTPDQSVARLTPLVQSGSPFVLARYGDGAIEAMYGKGRGHTCDREQYTLELGEALFEAWRILTGAECCFAGDWLASRFPHPQHPSRYEAQFDDLLSRATHKPRLIHPEALLLRPSEELLAFYRAVQDSRCLYVGPLACRPVVEVLGASYVESPMSGRLIDEIGSLYVECQAKAEMWDVLLWGCGMAGSVLAASLYQQWPHKTFINVGSAFDAIYRKGSRSGQMQADEARRYFKGVLA